MNPSIRIADSDADIARCQPVMCELRPHVPAHDFLTRVRRQMDEGYRLAFVEDRGEVMAVAGYRVQECLFRGRFMYVDDLVTTTAARSRGYGGQLFDWLVAAARTQGCAQLALDSGVQRFDAHRFYLSHRMDIVAHHFALKL